MSSRILSFIIGTALVFTSISAHAAEVHMATGLKVVEVDASSAVIWTRLTKHKTRNTTGTPFEDAARSPLIIVDPRIDNEGSVTEAPAEFTDVFPTLCDLSGLSIPEQLEGISLKPVLENSSAKTKAVAITV